MPKRTRKHERGREWKRETAGRQSICLQCVEFTQFANFLIDLPTDNSNEGEPHRPGQQEEGAGQGDG